MTRKSRWRRFVCAVMAVMLAAAATVVCVPEPAEAAEAHCPASGENSTQPDTPVMDCCVTSPHQAPALPDRAPASRTESAKYDAGLDVPAREIPAPVQRLSLSGRAAPHHRYHAIDLTTLYSTLLI